MEFISEIRGGNALHCQHEEFICAMCAVIPENEVWLVRAIGLISGGHLDEIGNPSHRECAGDKRKAKAL